MKKVQGFTLLEVLIALAVFAILATITSSSLYYSFNTRQRLTEQVDNLSALQFAIIYIERDTQQIALRDIYASQMQNFPAFTGNSNAIEFTRSGFANPNSAEKRALFKRIALLCHGDKLLRRTWITLDTTNRKAYQDKVLIQQLTSCSFSYLNNNLQSLNEWRANALQPNQRQEPLPKAIQMNLKFNNLDKISYLFTIPEAMYVDK